MLSMLGGPAHPAVSRRNPKDEYELLNRIGSGTYGEVYKVFYYSFVNFLSSLLLYYLLLIRLGLLRPTILQLLRLSNLSQEMILELFNRKS